MIVPGDTRKGLLEEGGHTELCNRGMGRRDIAGRGHCPKGMTLSKSVSDCMGISGV